MSWEFHDNVLCAKFYLCLKEAPTNKLLYAKDIPLYKEEVKAFYKAIKDLPSLSASELEEFLTQESKVLLNSLCCIGSIKKSPSVQCLPKSMPCHQPPPSGRENQPWPCCHLRKCSVAPRKGRQSNTSSLFPLSLHSYCLFLCCCCY